MINYILIYLLLISFLTPQSECDCEEPINTWFKVATTKVGDLVGNEIQILDMSCGWAFFDESYIYLVVYEKDTNREITVRFPSGVKWVAPEYISINEKFEDLEDYLKSNQDKSIEIKKQ